MDELHFINPENVSPILALRYLEQFTLPFMHRTNEQNLLDQLSWEIKDRFKVGLVIGRFQPLHYGHIYLFKQALTLCDTLIIGIGSADVVDTESNPFSIHVRDKIVRSALRFENIGKRVSKIIHLNDYEDDDSFWLEQAAAQTRYIDAVVGNNGWVNGIFKAASIPAIKVPLLARDSYQGSVIRQFMKEEKILDAISQCLNKTYHQSLAA